MLLIAIGNPHKKKPKIITSVGCGFFTNIGYSKAFTIVVKMPKCKFICKELSYTMFLITIVPYAQKDAMNTKRVPIIIFYMELSDA